MAELIVGAAIATVSFLLGNASANATWKQLMGVNDDA